MNGDSGQAGKPRAIVSNGFAAAGVVVSAAAVLNLMSGLFGRPFQEWFNQVIIWYQTLFHPIVDVVFGKLLSIIHIELTSQQKNIIVIYTIIGSALGRAAYRYRETSDGLLLCIFGGIIWPAALFYMLWEGFWGPVGFEQEDSRLALRRFLVEILFVAVVVLTALLLNAAGS